MIRNSRNCITRLIMVLKKEMVSRSNELSTDNSSEPELDIITDQKYKIILVSKKPNHKIINRYSNYKKVPLKSDIMKFDST